MCQCKFLILLLIVIGGECADPEVTTKSGIVIRGKKDETSSGRSIEIYLGIPYAKPPVKELRFKNPEKWTENRTDTREAYKNGPSCIQIDNEGVISGEEDCLYLNVFSPKESKTNNSTNSTKVSLPVLVFIRGGSFNTGTSNSDYFSPEYILNHDVVLVTFNYRLSSLGFYSTGNDESPGNYGLKDMVTVLKWVQENIETFKGNPKSVTLFGNSAGAAAIHHLALSPKTKDLFHKIITMSGSALAPWAYHSKENIRNSSITLARKVGCFNVKGRPYNATIDVNVTNHEEVDDMKDSDRVNCMRSIDVNTLLKLTNSMAVWKNSPNCIFGPTSENELVTVSPRESIINGNFQNIPWIIGVTADEGLGLVNWNEQDLKDLAGNFTDVAPYVLEYQQVLNDKENFTKRIIDHYFQGNISANIKVNITKLLGDAGIYWPVYEALQMQMKNMKNIYFYHFAYEGTFSVTMGDKNRQKGVAHMDDVNYLFPFLEKQFTNSKKNLDDETMVHQMTELFTSFARDGKPKAQLTDENLWKPYHKDNKKFMKLGNGNSSVIAMEDDFLGNRMNFWESLMSNVSDPAPEKKPEKKPNNGASFTYDKTIITSLLFFVGLYNL